MICFSDPLDAASLTEAIQRRRSTAPEAAAGLGRRVEYHPRIDSTSDRARDIAASGESEGTVVIADEQTAGRGRSQRHWHSPAGMGVYFSVILRPEAAPAQAPIFGLMAAVAVAEALQRISGLPIRIKWPNDLVVDTDGVRRKLAGILSEARTTSDGIRDLVIGVGVNVNHAEGDFPPEIRGKSTSLRLLKAAHFSRAEAAAEILTRLDAWYTLWNRHGHAPLLAAYTAAAVDLVGRAVRVTGTRPGNGEPEPVGTTAGLDADGALRVVPDEGGDVLVVRYGEIVRLEEP